MPWLLGTGVCSVAALELAELPNGWSGVAQATNMASSGSASQVQGRTMRIEPSRYLGCERCLATRIVTRQGRDVSAALIITDQAEFYVIIALLCRYKTLICTMAPQ